MKTRNRLVDCLIIISLLGLLTIIFMPTMFPMQYTSNGEVSRWGNKNEFFIYWLIPVVFGIVSKASIACRRKKQRLSASEYLRNEKPLLTSTIFFMLFFDIIIGYIIIRGFVPLSTGTPPSSFHFINVSIGMTGILLAAAGNYMPKVEYNSMIGFKNTWSTANERSWQLTHRWVGRLIVFFGFALIVFAVLSVNQPFSGVLFLTIVLLLVAFSFVLSYIAYQKTKQ